MHSERLWTMKEAMLYCGISSRTTFYKRLEEWKNAGLPTPYIDINPAGHYEVRRFIPEVLRKCLEEAVEKNSRGAEGV